MSQKFLERVGKAKILRNIQGGLDEMLIIAYMVGGRFQKAPKSAYVIYGRTLIVLTRSDRKLLGGIKSVQCCVGIIQY